MSGHGGDRVAEVLRARGVRFLFTLCGGHISPILSGAKARGIRVVDVRDEATAVFAADAVARLTGAPGVAAVTAGPGVTNTITAVKNAQMAQSAVVLLGGAAPTVLKGRGALQDIDQIALLEPHVKLCRTVRRVRDLAPMLERAFDVAQSGVPGPVFLECPIDLLYDEPLVRGWYLKDDGAGARSFSQRALQWYLRRHLDRQFAPSRRPEPARQVSVPVPRAADAAIDRIAGALRRAAKPVMVVGSQAMLRADRAEPLAAAIGRLGVPAYLSGMARGLLGRDHPLQVRHKRRLALKESDCVLLAGVPADFRLDYGRQIRGRATLISVNRSARDLRMNRRPTIGVVADPGDLLLRLADRAAAGDGETRADWLLHLRRRDDEREAQIDADASRPSDKVNPLYLCRQLDRALDDDSVLVADGGDFVGTASYTVRPRAPLSWLDPGAFGTLGVGAGFALGAKLVRPDSEVWIVYGDGAFGYSLIEFDTFARLGLPVIALIGNDAGWTQIAREQVKILKDDVATVLAPSAYHGAAEGLGAAGLRLDTAERIPEVLARAKDLARSGRPVVINAMLGKTDFREGSISM